MSATSARAPRRPYVGPSPSGSAPMWPFVGCRLAMGPIVSRLKTFENLSKLDDRRLDRRTFETDRFPKADHEKEIGPRRVFGDTVTTETFEAVPHDRISVFPSYDKPKPRSGSRVVGLAADLRRLRVRRICSIVGPGAHRRRGGGRLFRGYRSKTDEKRRRSDFAKPTPPRAKEPLGSRSRIQETGAAPTSRRRSGRACVVPSCGEPR